MTSIGVASKEWSCDRCKAVSHDSYMLRTGKILCRTCFDQWLMLLDVIFPVMMNRPRSRRRIDDAIGS